MTPQDVINNSIRSSFMLVIFIKVLNKINRTVIFYRVF